MRKVYCVSRTAYKLFKKIYTKYNICLHNMLSVVHIFAFPVKSKEHRLTIAATECVEDALLKKQNKTKGDIITSC